MKFSLTELQQFNRKFEEEMVREEDKIKKRYTKHMYCHGGAKGGSLGKVVMEPLEAFRGVLKHLIYIGHFA